MHGSLTQSSSGGRQRHQHRLPPGVPGHAQRRPRRAPAAGRGATGKSGSLVRMHYTNEAESRLAHESLKVFRNFGEHHRAATAASSASASCSSWATRLRGALHATWTASRRSASTPRDHLRPTTCAGWCPACESTTSAPPPGSRTPASPIPPRPPSRSRRRRGVRGAAIQTDVRGHAHRRRRRAGDRRWRRRTAASTPRGGRARARRVVARRCWPRWASTSASCPTASRSRSSAGPRASRQRHPVIIDAIHHSWMRPEGRGLHPDRRRARRRATPIPSTSTRASTPDYVALCREALSARFPSFAGATMRGGWAGMIMMSPDGRPIIDHVRPSTGST